MVRLRLHRREPLRAELEAFVAASRGEPTTIVTGQDALTAIELAQALVRSGREHQTIVMQEQV
jgi:UDP-N-acetylglucosamine 3-dehydrogenase